MAFIVCPECRRQVSTLAHICPGCGAPVAGAPSVVAKDAPGWVGRLLAVLGAWLVAPWVARAIAAVAGMVMLIVMFASTR